MPISEEKLFENLKETINHPLAALVSRLRNKAEGKKITTEYIDQARQMLEHAIAASILLALKEVESNGIEWDGTAVSEKEE